MWDGWNKSDKRKTPIAVCKFESERVAECHTRHFLFPYCVLHLYVDCCIAAGVMVIPDSLPMDVNMDVCDTMPMFEDTDGHGSSTCPGVFTSGTNASDANDSDDPVTPSVDGDHVDGNGKKSVDSLERSVKKPRVLPPVPAFQSSKPDESDVP